MEERELKDKWKDFNISFKTIKNGMDLSTLTLSSLLAAKDYSLQNALSQSGRTFKNLKIWLLSSFTGLHKLKEYSNYDVGFTEENPYLWSIPKSQAIKLLGNFSYFVHISDLQEEYLKRKLSGSAQEVRSFLHPNSILGRHINNTLREELLASERYLVSPNTSHITNFLFPQMVWVFQRNINQMIEEDKKWIENTIYYCKGFDVRFINDRNYQDYLTDQTDIESTIRQLEDYPLISEDFKAEIISKLIVYYILRQNGGIYIAKDVYLTEQLAWVN